MYCMTSTLKGKEPNDTAPECHSIIVLSLKIIMLCILVSIIIIMITNMFHMHYRYGVFFSPNRCSLVAFTSHVIETNITKKTRQLQTKRGHFYEHCVLISKRIMTILL